MVDPETYIKDGLKIVKNLMVQDNLSAALNICHELLKINPYHRKVQKYLKKIEGKILQKNEEKVDADIDATMNLWDQKRYDDLFKIYTKLYQYAPQHKRLQRLIEKLNSRFNEQQKTQREKFIEQAFSKIENFLEQKKFADCIQACNELFIFDPLNAKAKIFLKEARSELIEQKLEENKRIAESSDFQRVLEFYESLLAIDPENTQLQGLALQAKANVAEQKALAERIHLNESIARMKELFNNADYEKVIQACEEIDRLNAEDFTAEVFKKKSLAAINDEIEKLSLKIMLENSAALEPEYNKNPAAFVKL